MSDRKQILDLTCETCGGSGWVEPPSEPPCSHDPESTACRAARRMDCPACNGSGQVEAIVIRKENGEWPEWALKALANGFSADFLNALAEAYRAQGEK